MRVWCQFPHRQDTSSQASRKQIPTTRCKGPLAVATPIVLACREGIPVQGSGTVICWMREERRELWRSAERGSAPVGAPSRLRSTWPTHLCNARTAAFRPTTTMHFSPTVAAPLRVSAISHCQMPERSDSLAVSAMASVTLLGVGHERTPTEDGIRFGCLRVLAKLVIKRRRNDDRSEASSWGGRVCYFDCTRSK
jgi:hypothetical protein